MSHLFYARLSFATQYLVYENFTFNLIVKSSNFCGESHFCVRRNEIESFCTSLSEIYSALAGSAILCDNDSDGFVKFDMEYDGHLTVSGQVGGSNEDHSLRFKFLTDQTCIPKFTQDFKKLLVNQYT